MNSLRLTLVALVLILPLSVHAQEDGGVSLTISFRDGISRFHVGEVIPIELSFRALVPDAYDINTRNYDRSGRLNIEQFHVTPPGRDPLKNYYSFGGFLGGGLGSQETLSSQPYVMHDDLNEWVALDKPGHYSLYVTSGRVARRGAQKDEPVQLQSNIVEFDIVAADPAWQQETLRSAVSILGTESSTPQEKGAALRTLRFLDTPESVEELVHLLGTRSDNSDWNEIGGLAGSRYQSLVVRELKQQMSNPDIGLTGSYLYILTKLKFQLDHKPFPPYPAKDAQAQKAWEEQSKTQDQKFAELQDALYERAAGLVPNKAGRARAETILALLQRPSQQPGDIKPLAEIPPEEIASAFLSLSEDQQWNLLMSFWERLAVPAMFAPLEQVATQPDMKQQMLRDLALRRLYELDPNEARPIFLEEIMHPHLDNGMFTVKGETLGLLPDKALPQFDQILSARLGQKDSRTMGLDAQLVARYSTKAILPQVKAIYERGPGQWDCVTEDGFVLYFLRVDPDYGVKRLAVAPSACMTNSLPAVIQMKRWSEVEPGIIARLNGPDLNRARQAAEALAKYGDAQAEKALWERLRRFHTQWAKRENELVADRPGMARDANEAMGFQFGLVEAIGRAQAWLVTDEQITELENLTLGQERDNVKRWHWSSPVELNVNFFGEKLQATVAQYSEADLASLQAKLGQYPAGTKFWLNIFGPPDRVASVLAAIDNMAAEYGFEINSPSAANP
jgi:hypothetical protein